jgi:3-oxoacyl-[acyl-carrier-protein] synthase II
VSARVVVTGVGCLGPYGLGAEALAESLRRGEALGTPIDRSRGYHRKNGATLVGKVGPVDLSPWLSPAAARRMSDLSQFGVAAARMALAHAGIAAVPAERTSVSIATAFGPGEFTEQLARQILEKGGKAASPFLFTDCVANAAAGQIAIDLGARGPNTTICQREAGPLLALAQGSDDVARGRADVCLAGAVDELKPLSHAILDRFRALPRPGPHGEVPRPFDRRRSGYLAAEGATVLVLESEDHARRRGAEPLAVVGPTARAFDPSASRAGFGREPEAVADVLRQRLGAAIDGVAGVVSAASGARHGDRLEALVLRHVLPDLPPVFAPKAVHGEFGGGILAAALLLLRGAEIGRVAACDRPDPDLGIRLAHGRVGAGPLLLTAHGAGGVSAMTLLTRP